MTTSKLIDFNCFPGNCITALNDGEIDHAAGLHEFSLDDEAINAMLLNCHETDEVANENKSLSDPTSSTQISENPATDSRPTTSANSRFKRKMSSSDIDDLNKSATPQGTLNRNQWAANLLNRWRVWRKLDLPESINLWKEDDMQQWLPYFIHEIVKENGERYQNDSLYSIIAGLQNQLNNDNQRMNKINFCSDFKFKKIRDSLDSAMKISAEKCPPKKKAEIVSFEEEDELWKSKQLGSETPTQIINTLFYYNGLHFAIRGGSEHRSLKIHQFHIEQEPRSLKKIVYREGKTKTNAGGLKHRKFEPVIKSHYENVDQPERCHVRIFEKYMNMRPQDAVDDFYLKPLSNRFSGRMVIGINSLKMELKNMFENAKMMPNKSNHALRATCATRMFCAGVDEQIIMKKTGHRSVKGVRSYKRIHDHQLQEASMKIDGSSIQTEICNSASEHQTDQIIFNITAQNITINNNK